VSDGSCLNPQIAKLLDLNSNCPAPQTWSPQGYCVGTQVGDSSGCTAVSNDWGPGPCCLPGQSAVTINNWYPPGSSDQPFTAYGQGCCPVGQVSNGNGACIPQVAFVSGCAGNAPFNPQTNACCPAGSTLSNTYQCCQPGTVPQPNGACGCPWTDVENSDGSCAPLCPANALPVSSPASAVQFCSNCPPAQSGLPGCCPLGTPSVLVATCTYCASGQVGTQDGCCPANQATTSGTCCPGNTHAEGAWCYGNNMSVRRDACPLGQPRLGDGRCSVTVAHATPGTSVTVPGVPPTSTTGQCTNGLVRRDAFRGDEVCVTKVVHDQTIADNIAAPSRTNPDGGCIAGYVWREASADDHVCVLPATRTQTWTTNRQQCGGDLHCKSGVPGSTKIVVAKPVVEPPRRTTFRPGRPHRGTVTRVHWHTTTKPQPLHERHTQLFRGSVKRSKR
jgi:hypothetical protein